MKSVFLMNLEVIVRRNHGMKKLVKVNSADFFFKKKSLWQSCALKKVGKSE
jgi:hypothetical protein